MRHGKLNFSSKISMFSLILLYKNCMHKKAVHTMPFWLVIPVAPNQHIWRATPSTILPSNAPQFYVRSHIVQECQRSWVIKFTKDDRITKLDTGLFINNWTLTCVCLCMNVNQLAALKQKCQLMYIMCQCELLMI